MSDRFQYMRQAREEGRPSMRSGSNMLVDPALVQVLCLAACTVDPATELHTCPECEAAHETVKRIEHDDDCPIGDLWKRATYKLDGEVG